MKVTYQKEVDVKEPSTDGKNSYLVALQCGGLMEDPEIWYTDYQVIRADTAEEAKRKYDEINECSYFYGKVMQKL
jgi:hypothetical protein